MDVTPEERGRDLPTLTYGLEWAMGQLVLSEQRHDATTQPDIIDKKRDDDHAPVRTGVGDGSTRLFPRQAWLNLSG